MISNALPIRTLLLLVWHSSFYLERGGISVLDVLKLKHVPVRLQFANSILQRSSFYIGAKNNLSCLDMPNISTIYSSWQTTLQGKCKKEHYFLANWMRIVNCIPLKGVPNDSFVHADWVMSHLICGHVGLHLDVLQLTAHIIVGCRHLCWSGWSQGATNGWSSSGRCWDNSEMIATSFSWGYVDLLQS